MRWRSWWRMKWNEYKFTISQIGDMLLNYVEESAVSPMIVSHDLILLSAVAEQVSILFHQIKASWFWSQTNLNVPDQKKRTTAPLMCANPTVHYNHVFRLFEPHTEMTHIAPTKTKEFIFCIKKRFYSYTAFNIAKYVIFFILRWMHSVFDEI